MTSHNFHVLSNALKLAKDCEEPEVLIVAALFHDIGNKLCKIQKRVESDCCTEEMRYAFRIEHQYHSVVKTIEILKLLGFTNDFIIRVVELVIDHDIRKYHEDYVSKDDTELRLHVSDCMWMLSDDGLECDRKRSVDHGNKPLTKREQIEWNSELINGWFKSEFKEFKEIVSQLKGESYVK